MYKPIRVFLFQSIVAILERVQGWSGDLQEAKRQKTILYRKDLCKINGRLALAVCVAFDCPIRHLVKVICAVTVTKVTLKGWPAKNHNFLCNWHCQPTMFTPCLVQVNALVFTIGIVGKGIRLGLASLV